MSTNKGTLVQGVISLDFKVKAPSKDNGFKDKHYRDIRVLSTSIVNVINDIQSGKHIVFIKGYIGAVKNIEQAGLFIFNVYDGQASIACCYYSTGHDVTGYISQNKFVRVVGRKHIGYKVCVDMELPLCIQAFQVSESVVNE